MKIDLVYLWVDGSDKKWLAKKNVSLAAGGRPLANNATRDSRWDDNDELKYSLRSAEKFAPWINHIYIITDDQRPSWFKSSNRITVIDHRDIIPKEYLPTFNSSMIEMFLHNIPGLSEHFLFANDDFFFGASVGSEFFFDADGNPIVIAASRRWSLSRRENDQSRHRLFFRTIRNSARLVYSVFGLGYNLTMKHAIEPMRKSYLADNINQFRENFLSTTVTPFRENINIQRIVFPMLDNAKGRNTIVFNWRDGQKRIAYDVRRDSFFYRLRLRLRWLAATVSGRIKYDQFDKNFCLLGHLKKYRPKEFCINNIPEKKLAIVTGFLKEMFPEKSEFEK
ncbi:MAG: stealth family protein [Alphaproteobacteria bacterium]|nr:stealth family protein [Alphaproteobacteria bacterium]